MSLQTQISNLITRQGTEFKSVRAVIGNLSNLTTTAKTDVVAAINEVKAGQASAGAQINDTTPGTGTVYSSSKTESVVSAAVANFVGAAPAALDTLVELAAALGGDGNFAANMATSLGNRVRVDAAQTFTGPQQAQARANIGAGTSNIVVGTGAGDAKAGNYQPAITDITGTGAMGRTVLAAADGPTVRTAIGAGTSSLTLGTTNTTAKAGDYAPPAATTGALGTVQLTGYLGGTGAAPTVRDATTAVKGAVQLATNAIGITGTDAAMAMTPAATKAVADLKVDATAVGNTEADLVALFNAAIL